MPEIIECVPNFSEGRDQNVIHAIADAIAATDGVRLLDVDPGADTNRTVMTFVGTRKGVVEGALAGIRRAAELIDMRKHRGAHARLGATDVCPLVPVAGISDEECLRLADLLAERVATELHIPVYLYEKSARTPERRNLANIRAGEYEGLAEKLRDPMWLPDYGEPVFNARSGATVIGVREFLIAYNVNLNTADRKLAHDIALTIRESGRVKRDLAGNAIKNQSGETLRLEGLLAATKAVGWYIDEYHQAQVSINLTNYRLTPPHAAYEAIRELARCKGMRVTGSELVGLIPLEAMLMAGRYYLAKQGKSTGVPESQLIRTAIQSLGLNDVSPFDPAKKIIEYQFREFDKPLTAMTLSDFCDELSTDSPAPGGGSVAALAGALGASLSAMVANLTHGKKGYQRQLNRMNSIAEKGQQLKSELLRLVDLDTAAFNRLMDAFRLPKKTAEEQANREQAIQHATREAAIVPLTVMQTALQIFELAEQAARHGNTNSVSDAGVGALAAHMAIQGAGYNVLINLAGVQDAAWCESIRQRVTAITTDARRRARRIDRLVHRQIESLKS